MLGKKLAHYEIVAKIGEGGMGEVWKASDSRLGRSVAIKVLPGHVPDFPEARARFEREARAISSLSHPNICTLYDIGEADGVDYLVMEYLEGETLATRLSRDRLPLAQVLRFGTDIAGALDAAHRRGIVHRDLKPGNVMLTRNGVKLLDFGLAKLVQAPAAEGETVAVTGPRGSEPLTERGTILGTFRYMSPEQLEGKEADSRTDIFALGALLYEMAAGRPAFAGQSRASLIAAILEREPPPVSTIEPLTPPALDRTIRRCLAKDPDARWQSAADVAAELSWIAEDSSRAGVPAVVSARRRTRERWLWTAVVPLVGLAVGFGVLALQRQRGGEAPVVRAAILPPAGRTFDLNTFHPGPVALSPDGSMIAFLTEGVRDSLWVQALASGTPRLLFEGGGLAYPFWSPDGRAVAFFAEPDLRSVDASGGPTLTLCDARNGKGGTWSEDGVIVFAPDAATTLFRVPATGGEAVQVTQLDSTRAEDSHRLPSFLPDGRHFLFFARSTAVQRETGHVMVGSLDGDPPRTILPSRSHALFASGRLLYLREATLLAQPFDLRRFELRGEPVPIADSVELLRGAGCSAFSVSRKGSLVFHPDQPDEVVSLVWHDRSGAQLGTLGDPANFGALAFSPDGMRLAEVILDADTGREDIWIHDLARDVRSRFTFDPMSETEPTWSPDGTYIYFASNRRGHFDLYRKSIAGPDPEELLLESGTEKSPAWVSPDGAMLLFNQGDDLWTLPLAAGGIPAILLQKAGAATCSRDGKWLCFTSEESGQPEVYLTTFPKPGRRWQLSPKGSLAATWWSATDLLYVDLQGAIWIVDVIPEGPHDLAIGKPRVFIAAPNRIQNGALHPDGERLVLAMRPAGLESRPATLVLNWPAIRRL